MKIIEKEELKKLQEIQKEKQILIFSLGDIEYQNYLINKSKQDITKQLEEIINLENNLSQQLINKYGDNINIDIETGEYK